jgi:hypothetical protein
MKSGNLKKLFLKCRKDIDGNHSGKSPEKTAGTEKNKFQTRPSTSLQPSFMHEIDVLNATYSPVPVWKLNFSGNPVIDGPHLFPLVIGRLHQVRGQCFH